MGSGGSVGGGMSVFPEARRERALELSIESFVKDNTVKTEDILYRADAFEKFLKDGTTNR